MNASSTPSAPTLVTRSLRNSIDNAMVITGDNAMIGKIRYVGPVCTAWNSSICPPAPVNPINDPSRMDLGSRSTRQPARCIAYSAGGIMVSAHTTYTSVSGNPCRVGNSAKAPHTPQNPVVISAYVSQGFFTSEAVRRTGHVAAAIGAVALAYAAGTLPDELAGRPRQQRIAVEVGPRNGVGEVLALDVHLEALEQTVVRSRRHPGEGVGDGRPPRHFRALRAIGGVARGVVPVHIHVERSLVRDQADRERGGRRLVDRAGGVAELIVS